MTPYRDFFIEFWAKELEDLDITENVFEVLEKFLEEFNNDFSFLMKERSFYYDIILSFLEDEVEPWKQVHINGKDIVVFKEGNNFYLSESKDFFGEIK